MDQLDVEYLRKRYITLLWKYGFDKACDGYNSENDYPPKSRDQFIMPDIYRLINIDLRLFMIH